VMLGRCEDDNLLAFRNEVFQKIEQRSHTILGIRGRNKALISFQTQNMKHIKLQLFTISHVCGKK
jgi:hypothetical protein